MAIDQTIIDKVLNILSEEVIPAEGCTEPVALAYVAARARRELGCDPERIDVFVSGNIIKNVKSVIVPNSGGRTGIEVAAAMGALAGDDSKGLLVIQGVTSEDLRRVDDFLAGNRIAVHHEPTDAKLYIRVEMSAGSGQVGVEVKHLHTNVTRITRNGKTVFSVPCFESDFRSAIDDRQLLSVRLIYDLAREIDIERIRPLFDRVISLNSAIAEEGLKERYGVNLGSYIIKNIEQGTYGNDRRNLCASFAAAGSDARMSGCPLPVMTTSGSGNQGMTASLPLIKYAELRGFDRERLGLSLI
ncbi:MAG: L-serine ammonia-lyase, iron-sulfur-dependent, subunit alpha, partial [Negativicutes bacterium]|nr:L-serine ammonia-lyase, iron-sulfur-dependent, subunit alpha [Negativicutes bacterium]